MARNTNHRLYNKVKALRTGRMLAWDHLMHVGSTENRKAYEAACSAYHALLTDALYQAHCRCQAGAWRDGERTAPDKRTPSQKARIDQWITAIIRLNEVLY